MGGPAREMRRAPDNRMPAPSAAALGSHRADRPMAQGWQWPQLGMNTTTTWSPASRSCTPAPVSTTTMEASRPSGIGRGRSPSMTDKSEWHSPAAAMRIRTSPAPGGARSTSSIRSGRLLA